MKPHMCNLPNPTDNRIVRTDPDTGERFFFCNDADCHWLWRWNATVKQWYRHFVNERTV